MDYGLLGKNINRSNIIFCIKSSIIIFIIFFVTFLLLAYPEKSASGINDGLMLCFDKVIASLFPFMILSDFLLRSGLADYISVSLANITEKLFKLPKETASVIIMSFIGGYPVGPSMAKELFDNNIITAEQYKHLILFCVNPSISFCISFIGNAIYHNATIGVIVYISSVISSIITGIIYPFFSHKNEIKYSGNNIKEKKQINCFSALTESIKNSTDSMIFICATVIMFSAICRLIEIFPLPQKALTFISFFLEITSFVKNNSEFASVSVISAAVTFGGLCVHMQIMPKISNTKMKYSHFILVKALSSVISFFISKLLIALYPEVTIASANVTKSAILTKAGIPVSATLIVMAIIVILTDNSLQRIKNSV